MKKLSNKVMLLTGAGAGIARATAEICASAGAAVAILDINVQSGKAVADQICSNGNKALFIETDVTKDESVKSAVAYIIKEFGRLDIIFNCAGGSSTEDHSVHKMSLEVWHQTINLNLLHPFLTCRHGIPHIIKSGGGSIINVTSHLGLIGSVKPAYAATKGGIVSFTKTLAAQYSEYGIRANAIAPGTVRTERNINRYEKNTVSKDSHAYKEREAFKKLYPFATGEPEDIANIALFLASDDSKMLTGTTIAADGGRSNYLKVLANHDDQY